MNVYIAELIGTALLVLLGNGAVANVVLPRTKGNDSGWIVITAGWGLAVFVAVACTERFSGAHINPAVTLGLATAGRFEWALVPGYLAAQLAGAMVGAGLVWSAYRSHYQAADNPGAILATFATGAEIRSAPTNFVCEVIGTFVLVFTLLLFADGTLLGAEGQTVGTIGLGSLGAAPAGLLVFAIGLSLGGPTGYAINPARDLGPRIVHALLPIRGKRDSDWGYSWIPILGPVAGAGLAAVVWGAVVLP